MNKFNKFKVEISDIEWFDPEELLPKTDKPLLLVQHYRNCFCISEGHYDEHLGSFIDVCCDEITTDVCAWAYKPKVKRI